MGLVTGLLLFPVVAPVQGMRFVLEQLRAEAESMMLDEDRIRAEIMELEMRHDQGDISDEDYEVQETELLQDLNVMRANQERFAERGSEYVDWSDE